MMPTISLIGKPSAGKSTFFSAATLVDVEISERPFTTIKPNEGVAYVRVEDIGWEFNVKSEPRHGFIKKKWRFVPIKLLDTAGLIPDAHKGKGLGNQFLTDVWKGEMIIHVIDLSGETDKEGNRTENHDPEKDILFLEKELDMWFLSIIKNNWKKVESKMRAGIKKEDALYDALGGMVEKHIIEKHIDEEFEEMAKNIRRESKPIFIAGNKIDKKTAEKNYKKLSEKYNITPTSSAIELALKKATKAGIIDYIPGESTFEIIKKPTKEQEEALNKIASFLEKWKSTGIQQIMEKAIFSKYIAVFPFGEKMKDKEGRVLPDCFLMKKGSTLYDFAKKIHEDLAKNLLYGIDGRTKKRLSKQYKLKHRDAIQIISAAKK